MTTGISDGANLRYPYDHPGDIYGSNPQREQPQIYDRKRAMKLVDYSAYHGFTTFTLAYRGFETMIAYDYVEHGGQAISPITEPYASDVSDLMQYATRRGLSFQVECNPVDFPIEVRREYGARFLGAGGHVCPGKQFTFQLVEGKFTEFFRRYPECAGVSIRLGHPVDGEGIDTCHCASCASLSVPQRYAKMLESVAAVCRRHEKAFAVSAGTRLFTVLDVSALEQLDPLTSDALTIAAEFDSALIDSLNALKTDVLPGIGVRFDCWGEYLGWNEFPYYMGDVLAEQLRTCATSRVRHVDASAAWSPREGFIVDRPFGNVINLFLFQGLARDPETDPDQLLEQYVERTFPRAAHDVAIRLFKGSRRFQETWHTMNGKSATDHSRVFQRDPRHSSSYCDRVRQVMQPLCDSGFRITETGLQEREESIREALDGARSVIRDLQDVVPFGWYDALIRGAHSMAYCSLLSTTCIEMAARADGTIPTSAEKLRDLSERIRDTSRAWDEIDPVAYRRFSGGNAMDMWNEVAADRDWSIR